jgi:YD repeat-containing protein
MNGWKVLRSRTRAHPYAADAVLVAFMFAGSIAVSLPGRKADFVLTTPGVVAGALVCLALVVRRKWPLSVLAFTTLGTMAAIVATDGRTPYTAMVAVAAYTVASRNERVLAWASGATAAAVLAATAVLFTTMSWSSPRTVEPIAWLGMAVALGYALRTRRAYIAAVEERARRAERTREEEARRQVAEERLRIARELHDVVAHHIALISVQSGVATHLLRTQPDDAAIALGHVREASRSVLDELSTLLGVLRQPEDTGAPREPTPGLARLDELVDRFVTAGLKVDVVTSGRPRPLSPAADLAAYRIVQESLTNAQKHGAGGGTHVRLAYDQDGLRIEVHNQGGNPLGAELPASGGHGIIGMKERATSLGGTLRAVAEPDGAFRVTATLPRPEKDTHDHDPGTAGRRPGPDPCGLPGTDRLRAGPAGGG